MKNQKVWVIGAIVLVLVTLPYLIAWMMSGSQYAFGGFLLNPQDGNSYLAKMYQGWLGSWQFTLPFTADPGQGSYLFLFYLFLGHLAWWLGLPLLLVFHIVRVLAVIFLLFSLYVFYHAILLDEKQVEAAYLIACLCGGIGWLAAPLTGLLTPDLWVAEGYPFLSAYVNPHFPLALGLMLSLLTKHLKNETKIQDILVTVGLGLLLGIVLPFGAVIVVLLEVILVIWKYIEEKVLDLQQVLALAIGCGPVLLYQLWIVNVNPALGAWNSQNQTPSPDPLALFFGLVPVLFLAGFGIWARRKQENPGDRLLLVWAISGIVLLYLPFTLQRRFFLGLFIPLSGLAAIGLTQISARNPRKYGRWLAGSVAITIPTLLFVILSGISAVFSHNPMVVLSQGEAEAMNWLRSNTPQNALVLAAPSTGNWIPAQTGRRVLYGHPYETIDAKRQEDFVKDLFMGPPANLPALLKQDNIAFVFFGPQERLLGNETPYKILPIAWHRDGVTIYSVP